MRAVLTLIVHNEANVEVPVDVWELENPLVEVETEDIHGACSLHTSLHVENEDPAERL